MSGTKVNNRIRLLFRLLFVCLLPFASLDNLFAEKTGSNPDLVADFVWSEEFAGGSRILYCRYSSGTWGKPETVIETSGLNILPAIAAAGPDDMVVVWSTVSAKGIELQYSRFAKDGNNGDGGWGKGQLLSAKRTVNLAPVLLADKGGYIAFWSAHEGSDDDILSSRLTSGGWIEPNQVHAKNTEVDTLPETGFDQNRDVWVRWEAIGTEAAKIRLLVYEADSALGKTGIEQPLDLEQLLKESRQEFDLEPPVFFRSRSRATMYFHGVTTHPVKLIPGNLLP